MAYYPTTFNIKGVPLTFDVWQDPETGNMYHRASIGVPYFGNQDDGQDVADDTDDDGGYGEDEDCTMGSPAGETEEGL
jgi:hypothetical protein